MIKYNSEINYNGKMKWLTPELQKLFNELANAKNEPTTIRDSIYNRIIESLHK